MQATLIAPFLMRYRLGEASLRGGDVGQRLAEVVEEAIGGFAAISQGPESAVLFDHHQSTGGSRLGGHHVSGTVDVEDVGQVGLRFAPDGCCFAIITLEVTQRDDIHAAEARLVERLGPLVSGWTDRISTAMAATGLVMPASPAAQPAGKLLWWHRLLVDPPADQEPASTRVYGVEHRIHDDATLSLGDGFTSLRNLPRHRLAEVLRGLMAVTAEWIALDEANRLVSERLSALQGQVWKNVEECDRQFRASLDLSQELSLRELVRLEEGRYVTNAGAIVVEAARQAWRMEREGTALEGQLQTLRDILDFRRTMLQSRRDEKRNQLLFVFTSIALFQSVLVWYDFATSDDNTLAPALRLAIGSSIALLTISVVVTAVATRFRKQ